MWARTVTIQIVIFGLQGQLKFRWWFLGCKDSYNSHCDIWVAMPCSLWCTYQHYRGTCCLQLQVCII
jgi:hypothetical protein